MSTLDRLAEKRRARHRYGDITEGKVERWYGKDTLEALLMASMGAYAPMPIMGLPAALYRGHFIDRFAEQDPIFGDHVQGMAGFSSLSDLISEATTGGKRQDLPYQQAITARILARSNHSWGVGPNPAAGAAAAAPPGGTKPDRTTVGALGQANPTGGDTLHLVNAVCNNSAGGAVMIYDKLFATTTAANPGVAAIAVTGLQDRYTNVTPGNPAYPSGVVIGNRVTVVLPATAHNITYTYTDQDGNAGATSGAMVGVAAAAVNSSDFVANIWCAGLAGGDSGVKQLTAVTFSVSPATGQVEHFLMKPICIIPCPQTNQTYILDGINSAFSLVRIMDNAALTFMDFVPPSAATPTIAGMVSLVAG